MGEEVVEVVEGAWEVEDSVVEVSLVVDLVVVVQVDSALER